MRHKGLVTREWAVLAGVSERAIDDRIAAGVLIVLFPGVYRHAAVPFTRESRWLAAVLVGGPGALLSRRAAAVLHGVDRIRRVKPDVTVEHGRLPTLDGVDWHRARTLGPADRAVVDGIPVMALPRVLLELCAVPWLSYETVEHAAQHAVIAKKVTVEALFAVLDRLGGKGFTGTVAFRSILAGGLPDETIQSMLELLLDQIVESSAIPPGVRQHPLRCADGRNVVLDRAWHRPPDRGRGERPALARDRGAGPSRSGSQPFDPGQRVPAPPLRLVRLPGDPTRDPSRARADLRRSPRCLIARLLGRPTPRNLPACRPGSAGARFCVESTPGNAGWIDPEGVGPRVFGGV